MKDSKTSEFKSRGDVTPGKTLLRRPDMRKALLLVVAVLLLANLSGAKDEPKFKSIEVKHFSQVEGVELPPEFSDFL